jgi:hypothetical protein
MTFARQSVAAEFADDPKPAGWVVRSLAGDAIRAERFRSCDAIDPRVGVITHIVIAAMQFDLGNFDLLCSRAGQIAEYQQ